MHHLSQSASMAHSGTTLPFTFFKLNTNLNVVILSQVCPNACLVIVSSAYWFEVLQRALHFYLCFGLISSYLFLSQYVLTKIIFLSEAHFKSIFTVGFTRAPLDIVFAFTCGTSQLPWLYCVSPQQSVFYLIFLFPQYRCRGETCGGLKRQIVGRWNRLGILFPLISIEWKGCQKKEKKIVLNDLVSGLFVSFQVFFSVGLHTTLSQHIFNIPSVYMYSN